MSSCKNLISIFGKLRIHSFGHVGVCCFLQLTNVYGAFTCARTIPLYGAIARARSLISNTLLERFGDGVAQGINVAVAEDNGLEALEEGSLKGFRKKSASICKVGQ